MAGRRTKATDARIGAVLQALKTGNTRGAAAAYAEVDRSTFYRWMETNPSFRDSVEKAEADAEVRFTAQVAKAATDGTWQAAAWWLERRRHEDFARRDKVDMTVDLRKEAERIASELNLEDVPGLIAEAERIARSGT